jgi:hypothetical protein
LKSKEQLFNSNNSFKTSERVALSYINDDIENEIKEDAEELVKVYHEQAEILKNTNKDTMYVNIKHLFDYDITYEMRELILNEYYR